METPEEYPTTITGEELRVMMTGAGLTHVEHHKCAVTGDMTFYVRKGDKLFFDDTTHLSPRSWKDAADWINMQTMAEVRNDILDRFGFSLPKIHIVKSREPTVMFAGARVAFALPESLQKEESTGEAVRRVIPDSLIEVMFATFPEMMEFEAEGVMNPDIAIFELPEISEECVNHLETRINDFLKDYKE